MDNTFYLLLLCPVETSRTGSTYTPLALLLHIWTLCTPLFGGYRDSPQCVPADPEQFDEDPDPDFYINAG